MSERGSVRAGIAVLLGALVPGLGHVYLRRFRRSVAWVLLLFGVALLLVPTDALRAFLDGDGVTLSVTPALLVASLSVVDAYSVARADRARPREASVPSCPTCSRDLDPELGFCQWCATELDADGSRER